MLLRTGILMAAVIVLQACAGSSRKPAAIQARGQATDLSRQLLDIADVASAVFSNEVARMRLDGADDVRTFAAESVRNNAVSYIQSIALDGDPATGLLDLYAFAQLGIWACENRARLYGEVFFEDCEGTYGVVLDRTRSLAEKWMTEAQRRRIDDAVARYKLAHPDRTSIGILRLPDLARSAGTTTDSLRSASPTLFSPVSEAAEQLEQTRLLGSRVLWLLSRLPQALGWRAQTVLMEAFASDAFRRIESLVVDLRESIEGMKSGLAETRTSIDSFASRTAELSEGLDRMGTATDRLAAAATAIEPLAESLDRTTAGLDRMAVELGRFEQHATRMEQGLAEVAGSSDRLGDDLDAVASRLNGLDDSVESLGSSVEKLQNKIVEIETLEGQILESLLWKVMGMAAVLIVLTGLVIVISVRFGRR